MNAQDCEQLTLFPADSPASLSVLPGSEEARATTVTSGMKCCELYKKSGQLGSLVRMCLESSIWHSTRCLLRWKVKVTKSKRSLFQLAALTPRTKETASLLWPTLSTGAALCGWTANFQTLKRFAELGIITEQERRNLSQGNGGKTNPDFLEWMMGYEEHFTRLIPTPRASDYKGAATNRFSGVGGYIETVTFAQDACVICNEEGRLLGMEDNCRFLGVDFVGPILVVGVDGEKFTDVPAEELLMSGLRI